MPDRTYTVPLLNPPQSSSTYPIKLHQLGTACITSAKHYLLTSSNPAVLSRYRAFPFRVPAQGSGKEKILVLRTDAIVAFCAQHQYNCSVRPHFAANHITHKSLLPRGIDHHVATRSTD